MNKIEKYIPISFTSLALFASFMMTFVNLPWFGFYSKAKYVLTGFVFIYVFYNISYLKCNWVSLPEKLSFYLYIVCSFIASFMNLGETTYRNPRIQCLGYCGILLANYLLAVVVYNKGRLKSMLEISWWTSLFIMLFSDLTVLLGLRINGDYFIGNKFAIVYHHLRTLVLALLIMKEWNRRNKIIVFSLFFESMLISIILDCATGLIGTILLVFILLLYYNNAKITRIPFLQVVILLICALFPVWYQLLLNNSLVQLIIESVLHKKLTLTGRTVIYSKIPVIFGEHFIVGYGINTNYEICMRWGATNIQNGMLKIMMESGVMGAVAVLLLYLSVFWRINKSEGRLFKTFAALLLVMSILSSVEITISGTTITVLLYLAVFSNMRKESA